MYLIKWQVSVYISQLANETRYSGFKLINIISYITNICFNVLIIIFFHFNTLKYIYFIILFLIFFLGLFDEKKVQKNSKFKCFFLDLHLPFKFIREQ